MNKIFSFFFKQKDKSVDNMASNTSSITMEGFRAIVEAREIIKKYPKGGPNDEYLLTLLDKAIEGGFREAYEQRAFCLQGLDYNYDAIFDFDMAISESPNDPNLFFGRGHSKKILMQFDEAIVDLKKALHLAQEKSDLIMQYDNEMQKSGWKSVAQFYESQLDEAVKRKEYLKSETLRVVFLEKLGTQKRRDL